MDLTGFLDVSRIANDENLFFLGMPFVNNPAIAFPDYVLGTTVDVSIPRLPRSRIALALSSSHGLADNPEASYGELVDLGAARKGVFVAGRARWDGEVWRAAIGGWVDPTHASSTQLGEDAQVIRGRDPLLLGFTIADPVRTSGGPS